MANKRLIYDYFGDKVGFFDAVLDNLTEEGVGAVPIDAADLPAYAGRLFDFHLDHPELLRLATWRDSTDGLLRRLRSSARLPIGAGPAP